MYSEFRAKFNFLPQSTAIKTIYSDRLIKGSLHLKVGWDNQSCLLQRDETKVASLQSLL